VAEGEFVSVVGPSGCGKTTLLKVVAGVEPLTSGTVRVNGKAPAEARRDRAIGFVFQDPVLFGWRNVLENVRLPGELFRDQNVVRQAQKYIEMVRLHGFEHAYPRELSGGMQSRVALARALSFEPQILLMDEPFGDLDEMRREEMNLELLRVWQETRATVVFVTHSLREAVFLSDRVVVLTERPAHVQRTVTVGLPRPRTLDVLESPELSQLVKSLREQVCLAG
jgi:NitT/TauT family transport system ATP-binding protein